MGRFEALQMNKIIWSNDPGIGINAIRGKLNDATKTKKRKQAKHKGKT